MFVLTLPIVSVQLMAPMYHLPHQFVPTLSHLQPEPTEQFLQVQHRLLTTIQLKHSRSLQMPDTLHQLPELVEEVWLEQLIRQMLSLPTVQSLHHLQSIPTPPPPVSRPKVHPSELSPLHLSKRSITMPPLPIPSLRLPMILSIQSPELVRPEVGQGIITQPD